MTEEILTTGRPLSLAVFGRFHPNIGGIETVAELLAREWVAAGHRVTIVTDVPAGKENGKVFPFPVLHRPGPAELLRVVRDCDLVIHHNISLQRFWPVILTRKPFVAVNHDRYALRPDGGRPWRERIKVWIARHWAHSLCVSNATKQGVGCDGPVIHNLYDRSVFTFIEGARDKDIVFIGRLVSDKGVPVLIDALAELRRRSITPSLTIIGDGPECPNIERQIHDHGLEKQVVMTGRVSRDEVVNLLNRHRIMVVPSVYDEGFGVVALEGIACGCVVVGSNGGGLPEAVGPCGEIFPMHDHRRLAEIVGELLADESRLAPYRAAAEQHLQAHHPELVAAKYVDFFEQVLKERRSAK